MQDLQIKEEIMRTCKHAPEFSQNPPEQRLGMVSGADTPPLRDNQASA